MKKRIIRLSVLQTGKFLAVFYALLAALFIPFFLLASLGGGAEGMSVTIIMLILYPIMGFIGGLIMAAFYNLVSKWVGGIEVTVEDSEENMISNQGMDPTESGS